MPINNINTKYYWNKRFSSGDWEVKQGRDQTRNFAVSQIRHLNISKDFTGTILDFGCGLGDAFPIYKKAFPKAKLIGLDISEEAIKKCKEKYGSLAVFICGTYNNVPMVDIIIASNVFEHLTDDVSIAKHLLIKCRQLNIIVPYKEKLTVGCEHINTYCKDSFQSIGTYNYKIFASRGWSQYGINLIYHVHLKNIIRILIGKPMINNPKQILYNFSNSQRFQDKNHMLYFMHISWYDIKQRPQFLAENLSPYFNLTVFFTENKPSNNKFIITKKPSFVKSIKILSLGRFSFIRKINGKIIEIYLRKQIKCKEFIWLTSPIYYYQIKKYIKPTQTLIYDCMDDILEFPPIKNNHELLNEYSEKEGKLISMADIIFVSSENLLKKIKSRYEISSIPILLNNAISSTFFTENQDMEENIIINDFPAKEEFIDLIYIGTISVWFDFELIIKSLIKCKQIRYILIGPIGIEIPDHDRIIYLGIKKHSELMQYMKKADALIMPFLVNDLIESVNPVKLYEYIYSGKPVITCSYSEINQFDDFVYRYNSEIEYFQLLERLINNDLKQKDINRCRKFALQNTWEKRVEIIRSTLFQHKIT